MSYITYLHEATCGLYVVSDLFMGLFHLLPKISNVMFTCNVVPWFAAKHETTKQSKLLLWHNIVWSPSEGDMDCGTVSQQNRWSQLSQSRWCSETTMVRYHPLNHTVWLKLQFPGPYKSSGIGQARSFFVGPSVARAKCSAKVIHNNYDSVSILSFTFRKRVCHVSRDSLELAAKAIQAHRCLWAFSGPIADYTDGRISAPIL